MNIKQLEYFVAVAESLSFTKAAEKYYISQTAVTQQIKALEEQINVELLIRSKRHVELTPAGKVFLNEARSIINHINDAITRTQEVASGFSGTLSIGIIPGYEKNNLPQYLRQFSSKCPNVSLEIRRDGMSELLKLISEDLLDTAFVINPDHQPLDAFNYKVVGRYSLMALLPPGHPFANRSSIKLKDLEYEKFIFIKEANDNYGQKSMVQDKYRQAGFIPNVVQRCNDFNTILLMVASNIGIAILPSFIGVSNHIMKNVCVVPLEGERDVIEMVAVWNKNNNNPALKRFISII